MRNAKVIEACPSPEDVRALRVEAGLTQEAAGELVFCRPRTWQEWEAGTRRMHSGLWLLFRVRLKHPNIKELL